MFISLRAVENLHGSFLRPKPNRAECISYTPRCQITWPFTCIHFSEPECRNVSTACGFLVKRTIQQRWMNNYSNLRPCEYPRVSHITRKINFRRILSCPHICCQICKNKTNRGTSNVQREIIELMDPLTKITTRTPNCESWNNNFDRSRD